MLLEINEQFDVTLGLLCGYEGETSHTEKALGYFLLKADGENALKIKEAFPDIWAQFRKLGSEIHARGVQIIPDFHLVEG